MLCLAIGKFLASTAAAFLAIFHGFQLELALGERGWCGTAMTEG